MAIYEVKTSCEYVIEVEAESKEQAMANANDIPIDAWDQNWDELEAKQLAVK